MERGMSGELMEEREQSLGLGADLWGKTWSALKKTDPKIVQTTTQ